MLDPLSALAALVNIAIGVWDAAQLVQQNREECRRLKDHVELLVSSIEKEGGKETPSELLDRLQPLQATLDVLRATLNELNGQSNLKKILWRTWIGEQIAKAYRNISEAVMLFNLRAQIDLRRFAEESEAARKEDAMQLSEHMRDLIENEHLILEFLKVHQAQMQEAMLAVHKRLANIDDVLMRQFLEKGLHAMQRRSGPIRTIPDASLITSLDVVINHDRRLGAGGYGEVFEGEWQGHKVAVKVLNKATRLSSIETEVKVWTGLRHPNVLEFFGASSISDPPFMVCAYKYHGDAARYLRKFPSANRRKLLYEASLGLRYLHQKSIIHGDLKAANILVDEHHTACICDFSLSKIRVHTTTVAGPGTAAGTLLWMAPEQLSNGIVNRATDVYSFGMTIFEIFTGNPPFANMPADAFFPAVVDRRQRPHRPDRPEIIILGLDDDLWHLAEKCWAHEPGIRPGIAEVVLKLEVPSPIPSHCNEDDNQKHPGEDSRSQFSNSAVSILGATHPRRTSLSIFSSVSDESSVYGDTAERYPLQRSPKLSIKFPDLALKRRATISVASQGNRRRPAPLRTGTTVRVDELVGIETIIAVMGPTGSGKSTFINHATGEAGGKIGHELESCTTEIRIVRTMHPAGYPIVLVDTPGFDDTHKSDIEILNLIAEWLRQTYQKALRLAGIIYLHRISDNRMAGAPLKNLAMFKKLCGQNAIRSVILATTMWSEDPQRFEEDRERELHTKHWKAMLDKGSATARFLESYDSAWAIIDLIIENPNHNPLFIQQEMVDLRKRLGETEAAIALHGVLQELLEDQQKTLSELQQLRRAAHADDNMYLLQGRYNEIENNVRDTLLQLQRLKVPLGRRIIGFFFTFRQNRTAPGL